MQGSFQFLRKAFSTQHNYYAFLNSNKVLFIVLYSWFLSPFFKFAFRTFVPTNPPHRIYITNVWGVNSLLLNRLELINMQNT